MSIFANMFFFEMKNEEEAIDNAWYLIRQLTRIQEGIG